jgi:hypothetical protein
VTLIQAGSDGIETTIATLPRAAAVEVSPDGRWLAWPEAGVTWLASIDSVGSPARIGAGSLARFSPDASLLLLFDPGSADVVDMTGSRLTRVVPPPAGWGTVEGVGHDPPSPLRRGSCRGRRGVGARAGGRCR